MNASYLKPLLPLRDIVIFPSMVVPLFVGREKSIKALQEVMKTDKSIVLVSQKNSEIDDPVSKDLYQYGCLSKVLQLLKLPDGTVKVLVEGEKRVKILKHNDNENNFSLIRNSEINRLCTQEIQPQYYNLLNIHAKMEELDACEDYGVVAKEMWKRENYEHKFCNKIINVNYKTQYCIIGVDTFYLNEKYILELYENRENDFILLDNNKSTFYLINLINEKKLDNMKCYALENNTINELVNYFKLIYKSCDDYVILFQEEILKN